MAVGILREPKAPHSSSVRFFIAGCYCCCRRHFIYLFGWCLERGKMNREKKKRARQLYGWIWCEQALVITSATDLVSICFISLLLLLLLFYFVAWFDEYIFEKKNVFFFSLARHAQTQWRLDSMRLFLSIECNANKWQTESNNNNNKKKQTGSLNALASSDTRAQIVNVYQWAIIAWLRLYNKLFIIFVLCDSNLPSWHSDAQNCARNAAAAVATLNLPSWSIRWRFCIAFHIELNKQQKCVWILSSENEDVPREIKETTSYSIDRQIQSVFLFYFRLSVLFLPMEIILHCFSSKWQRQRNILWTRMKREREDKIEMANIAIC